MSPKLLTAAAVFSLFAAGVSAQELRTVYQEEFDRYGEFTPCFSEACSIGEAPASLKHLEFKPQKQMSVHKDMFRLPAGQECKDYDLSFRFSFPGDSKRNFDITMFSSDNPADKKTYKSLAANIAENGSQFKNTPKSLIPPMKLTKQDDNLADFPDRIWHNALIKVRGKNIELYVERDGIMKKEAAAESYNLPLVGFNLSSATSFNIDSITVKAANGVNAQDFIDKSGEKIATCNTELKYDVAPDAQDISFAVKAGAYPSVMTVKFIAEDGTENSFSFKSLASSFDKPVRRQVAELKDGKLVQTPKFVREKTVLPDAGFTVQGPDKFNLKFYTRPLIQYRYEDDGAMQIVANWEKFPAASESYIDFNVVRTPGDYQIWLDGKYATSIKADSKIKTVSVILPAGGSVKNLILGKATEFKGAQKSASAKTELQLPLDVSKNARPGALANAENPLKGNANINGVNFIVADGKGSMDTGLCKENMGSFALECDGYLQRSAFDAMPESLHFRVPTAQYIKAYALCAVADDPEKVPVVTARLTKFRPGDGRAQAIADSTVTLPKAGEKLPDNIKPAGSVRLNGKDIPLYFVEFKFDAGSIQDVLLMENNPFLDFEFLGKLYEKDNYYINRAMKPALEPSSVQVFAATLEKSPVEFQTVPGRLTNIYYPDETPSMSAKLKAVQPGECKVEWQVTDIDGKVLDKGAQDFKFASKGEEKQLDLKFKQKEYGWYGVSFRMTDKAGNELVKQDASFSLIAPDTRKAGYESPYFVWNFGGAHGTASDLNIVGDILKRMGVRRTLLGKYSEKDAEKWGLTIGQYVHFRFKGTTDEEKEKTAEAAIKEQLEKYPHVKSAIIFHESGGGPFPMEMLGGKTVLTEDDIKKDKERTEQALFMAKMWRKYAPDVKLVIGNSGESISLLARLFREKYPREYIDSMGEESVGMTMPPERSVAYPNWQLRELARIYGYKDLQPEACFEWKSRVVRHFGPKKQAEMRTRDALIGLAWKQNLVPVVAISEMANSYYNTIWGDAALTRYPLLQPFPSFNATATLTQVFDRTQFIRMIPTGSNTVYALEFKRGSEFVYALWTARGIADSIIEFEKPADITKITLYGSESKVRTDGTKLSLKVSEAPVYLISKDSVKSASVAMTRTYPDEQYQGSDKAIVADAMGNAADWKLVMGQDKRIELPSFNPLFTSARRPGKFELRQVKDDIKGDCLELELIKEGDCPTLMQEYAFLKLNKPVTVQGTPNTIGVLVKGNSSWGKIFWELEDAEGEKWLSAGTGGYGCDVYDWPDKAGINFDGWHFLQFPITEKSPVKVYSPGENQWQWQHDGSGSRKIEYPVKLTGVGVMMFRKSLNLLEMQDVDGKIRLKDLSTY